MNRDELTSVLTKIAAYCKMTPPGKVDLLAWFDLPAIRDMGYADAEEAVRIYYQQHKSPMAPADLIQTVKALPRPGARRVPEPPPEVGELITIAAYGVDRFWSEADAARVAAGGEPFTRTQRIGLSRKLAATGVTIPVDAEDAF